MARDEAPPFSRGETFYNGTTPPDATSNSHLEGKTWVFEDLDYGVSGNLKTARSGRKVVCMCVRNVGAAALLPKRLVTLKLSGLNFLGQVDGYATTTAQQNAFPVDEFLPAAGVPVNDLFWIVIEGPAMMLTPLAGADFNGAITVGANLVSLTAATSGATTAGRVAMQNITGSSQATDYTFLVSQIQNRVGQAVSAKTTSNTGADVLVNVGKW